MRRFKFSGLLNSVNINQSNGPSLKQLKTLIYKRGRTLPSGDRMEDFIRFKEHKNLEI